MEGQRERERFLSALRATMRLKLYGQTFFSSLSPPPSFYSPPPLLNSSPWNKSVVVYVAPSRRYATIVHDLFFLFPVIVL